jgi:hypothetical protein
MLLPLFPCASPETLAGPTAKAKSRRINVINVVGGFRSIIIIASHLLIVNSYEIRSVTFTSAATWVEVMSLSYNKTTHSSNSRIVVPPLLPNPPVFCAAED